MATAHDEGIDAWLERLAGRAAGLETDPEVAALRAVLAARAAKAQRGRAGAAEDHALERLFFRLRQERLLRREPPAWALWLPAAAVAMLLAVFGLNLYVPGGGAGEAYAVAYEQPPQYRGGAHETAVPAPVPLAVARKLAAALDRAGAQPKLYVWQGKRVLDFDVSPQNLRAVTAELARLQLEAPRPGINRLVFDAQ